MKTYGYIRVSSEQQNADRQLDAIRKIGIKNERIYLDKQSGKSFERLEYQKLLNTLKMVIYSTSQVSTDWDEIMKKSSTSGESSQKKKAQISSS